MQHLACQGLKHAMIYSRERNNDAFHGDQIRKSTIVFTHLKQRYQDRLIHYQLLVCKVHMWAWYEVVVIQSTRQCPSNYQEKGSCYNTQHVHVGCVEVTLQLSLRYLFIYLYLFTFIFWGIYLHLLTCKSTYHTCIGLYDNKLD